MDAPPAFPATDQEILSSAPEQLVPLLYRHLLWRLGEARRAIEAHDVEAKSLHLERALAILFELLATLDFRRGGELAPRLSALYGYFASELVGLQRSLDLEQLGRITEMIAALHASWEHAARSVRTTASGERTT